MSGLCLLQVAIVHDRPQLFYDMQVRGAGFHSPYIDPDAEQLSLGVSTKQHELLVEGEMPFQDYGSGVTISETLRATYAAIAFPMPSESQGGSQMSHHDVVQRALAYMLAYTGGIFM